MLNKQINWKNYEPLIKAVTELFAPFVEVAVHDLEQGKIVALYHNISQRQVGDISPLQELKIKTSEFPNYFAPYYKKNWDGKALKCTSITVRDQQGTPVALICINVDTSFFQETQRILNLFLRTENPTANPIELFGSQCEEQALTIIQHYLEQNHLSLTQLKRNRKRELIQSLYQKGIFNYKNATPFLASYLNLSRASIYNYINQIGNTGNAPSLH